MKDLGGYLKKLRQDRQLSLNDVQEKTGISNSKLSRIENNKNDSDTDPSTLKQLAKIYGVSLVDLYLYADYLEVADLSSYTRVFHNVEHLTNDEIKNIQENIDLLTKGRTQL